MFCLEVSGPFACFTRPEMKVERVSYDVITPSAARAVFEAICWKPAIRWHIRRIEVLAPIRWISVRRNEVIDKISIANVKKAINGGAGELALYADDDKQRQQRAGLFLRDVRYRLHAEFSMTHMAGSSDNAGKFSDMFRRRAEKGQCVNQPYLGCREFACDFRLIDKGAAMPAPIDESREFGFMLYDMDFDANPVTPPPKFFRASMEKGLIKVPPWNSTEVVG